MSDLTALNLESGSLVGGYTLISRLGGGAMGSVWRVKDDGGNIYAMKILRDSLNEDGESDGAAESGFQPGAENNAATARERLRREAAALRRVNHPGVCQIMDMELDDSVAFIVTELIEGKNLRADVAANGRYVAGDLERLTRKLIDAVSAVHRAGIIHRDIKPTNVMISRTGPVLVDFGIAMGEGESHVTRTGLVMGTPGFIAPEIIDGAESDEQTDWWSTAAVLAFAATGQPVFGTTPMMAVLERAATGHANLAGLPPRTTAAFRSALDPKRENRCTPMELLQVIEQDALTPQLWTAAGAAGSAIAGAGIANAGDPAANASAPASTPASANTPISASKPLARPLAGTGAPVAADVPPVPLPPTAAAGSMPTPNTAETGDGVMRPFGKSSSETADAVDGVDASEFDGDPNAGIDNPRSLWKALDERRAAATQVIDIASGPDDDSPALNTVLDKPVTLAGQTRDIPTMVAHAFPTLSAPTLGAPTAAAATSAAAAPSAAATQVLPAPPSPAEAPTAAMPAADLATETLPQPSQPSATPQPYEAQPYAPQPPQPAVAIRPVGREPRTLSGAATQQPNSPSFGRVVESHPTTPDAFNAAGMPDTGMPNVADAGAADAETTAMSFDPEATAVLTPSGEMPRVSSSTPNGPDMPDATQPPYPQQIQQQPARQPQQRPQPRVASNDPLIGDPIDEPPIDGVPDITAPPIPPTPEPQQPVMQPAQPMSPYEYVAAMTSWLIPRGRMLLCLLAVPLCLFAAAAPTGGLIVAVATLWLLTTAGLSCQSQLNRESRRGGMRKGTDSALIVGSLPWHLIKGLALTLAPIALMAALFMALAAFLAVALGLPQATAAIEVFGLPIRIPVVAGRPLSSSGMILAVCMATGWFTAALGPYSRLARLGAGIMRGTFGSPRNAHDADIHDGDINDYPQYRQPDDDEAQGEAQEAQRRSWTLTIIWTILILAGLALLITGDSIDWSPLLLTNE
ncbi:protein kinase [Bifidobacterium sp. SMB2]|uniref:non-specific serine/threonine protein kinase n=1 Tax=Bifidobacterium saimiriisciurei TaxID=2661627 RepID=A0ABX0CCT8_9BIFI|nr:protein kinase [Bifidobacterium sp. SMB2]NEH11665.1 protein kinase [Bifidobacterium saimiriisciurei]